MALADGVHAVVLCDAGRSVRLSRAHALAGTQANSARHPVTFARTQRNVDTDADFTAVVASHWQVAHRSIGLTILVLTAVRLRVRHRLNAPVAPGMLAWLEDLAARVTHMLLYAILIVMPISGFLWTTSRGKGVSVFGLFSIPPLLPASETLHDIARTIHSGGQLAVYVVVGLHAVAALHHLAIRRDDLMARMLPRNWDATRSLPQVAIRPGVR